jgi:uncharacterized repeat protein (TIGR01451 family)
MFAARSSSYDRAARRPGPRYARGWLAALVAGLLVVVAGGFAATAQAAPPTVAFLEDFENTGNAAQVLTDYQGLAPAQNETYTAADGWLRDCNGWVITGTSPTPADTRFCDSASSWDQLRNLARLLGTHQGLADPNANHAVGAYTEGCSDPTSPQFGTGDVCGGANQVQWETETPITVPPNRFYTFSVDAAYINCFAAHPLFDFSIVAGGSEIPTSATPIDGCANGDGASTFTSPGAIFVTSASIGLRMRNAQGSTGGNDGAFDNVRLLDVTPRLHKSFSPASLNVNAPSTMTFTIENTDELAAKNGWSFTDNLPSGLVVANPAAASTTCSGGSVTAAAGGGSIAMTGNLDAGQASCTVSVNVTSSSAGSFSNCPANVTLVGLNPPACSTVTFRAADVAIVKSTASPVVPGEEATYSLTVTNHGPDTATNVVVSDPLPSGLSFVSASPECAEASGTVTCTVASLASGASQTFTVTANVAASADDCANLRNTATVTNDVFDPNTSNNSSSICNFERRANRTITKVASRAQVPTGGQVMYTLVVKNNGPSDDSNVTVTDPMAQGLSLVAAEASQGSCSTAEGRVSCDLGDLKAGGSAQVLVTAQMTATSGCVPNTARVTGDALDPTPDDNAASAQVCVEPGPEPRFDLAVDKRANRSTVTVGQRVTYTIVVTNNGPDAAPAAKLTDTYNNRATVVSVSTTAGSCTEAIPITCELDRIESGASVTITVVIKPRVSGRARNAASATSCCGTDTTPNNNMDTVDIQVRKVALKLSKVASRSSVAAGDTLSYRIRVRNPSKGEARNVKVCDRLPSGLSFVSSKPRARRSGGQRCWTIKSLKAGKSRTFRVTVRTSKGANGRKVNRATLSGPDTKRLRAKDPIRVLGQATPVTG